ncbi:MAG: glycosyltransferase family 4 protein [Pseudomonadota bacterium]
MQTPQKTAIARKFLLTARFAASGAGGGMAEDMRVLALFGSRVIFGAERGNAEALGALQSTGAEVLCVVRNEAWNDELPAFLSGHNLHSVGVPHIDSFGMRDNYRIILRNPIAFVRGNWKLFEIIRSFRPTHIHAFNQLFTISFFLTLALSRVPMVFRAGDEPTLHSIFWRAVWRFVCWRTTAFVANSRFVAKSLRKNGVSRDDITLIYSAPPSRTEDRAEDPLPHVGDNERVVAFVGQIAEHKGPHVLVEAFRRVADRHPDVRLALAGRISDWEGDTWARNLRDDVAADHAIGQRVHFLGLVDNVPALLKRSTVVVVPSLFDDPSPNVVMEAKAAGRPVIGFPRGGIPELVNDGTDGKVCEPNADALARALEFYLSDPATADAHGRAAKQTMVELGIPEFAARWHDVYARCQA